MRTHFFLLSFLFFLSNSFHAQSNSDFNIFSNMVDGESKISQLDKSIIVEQEKYNNTKNKYYLYNVRYLEARICALNKDMNGRLKKLIWVTEDCPTCETEQLAWFNYHTASALSSLNSNLSIDYALKSLKIARKRNYKSVYPLSASLLATIYYNNKSFNEAKKYFVEAKRNAFPNDTIFNASMFNNLGLCYMNMGQNKEAHIYYLKSLNKLKTIVRQSETTRHFQIVVEGNVGTILDRLGDYEQSITLLEKEVAYYLKHGYYNECTNPLIELLDLYQKMGKTQDEIRIVNQIQLVEKLDDSDHKAPLLTEKLYNYYLKKQMNGQALVYSEKLINKLKKYSERINRQSDELNQILYYEKITHLKKERNTQQKLLSHAIRGKKQSQTISFTLIVLVLLLFALGWLIIRGKTKRARKDAVIFEQGKQIEINKNIILENEIKLKQEKITSLALNLNLKKETEKAFLEKIKEIKRKRNVEIESVLRELQHSVTNLLQIDNKNIINNQESDAENARFIALIREKHTNLSEQEINFCTYFRMNLNSKEIASLNNMTSGTIRVYKTKIKNKIGLSGDQNLNEYLISLMEN